MNANVTEDNSMKMRFTAIIPGLVLGESHHISYDLFRFRTRHILLGAEFGNSWVRRLSEEL